MSDKVQLIKKEVERLHELLPVIDGDNVSINYAESICTTLEKYIESLPEEPVVKGLTWKDVNTLDTLIDQVRHEFPNGMSEKSFGLAVLEKFQDYHDDAEEPISEDLEEEINNYFKDWTFDDEMSVMAKPNHYFAEFNDIKEIARHFAKWQKQQMKEALQTEYEKGLFDMREEMMKNAVETTIVNDWQYGKDPDYAIIPAIHQRINGFNVGDKVKIIICKTEQQ